MCLQTRMALFFDRLTDRKPPRNACSRVSMVKLGQTPNRSGPWPLLVFASLSLPFLSWLETNLGVTPVSDGTVQGRLITIR